MKLGIVVVYLVAEENEKLLDLHFSQVEKHTKVPYTIYAGVKQLSPKIRLKVEQHPRVKICEIPETSLHLVEEHSFYLEYLVKKAVEDGVSHIVTLHVDSFPICSGWAEALAGRLSESCVFATPFYGAYTACLFFQRDFYLKYQPTFLLTEDQRASMKYKQFCKGFGHIPHSGIGYIFRAYSEGVSWYPLAESNKGDARFGFFNIIYEDLFFHLGAAAFPEHKPPNSTSFMPLRKGVWKRFWAPILRILLLTKTQQKLLGVKRLIMPRHLMSWGWKQIGVPFFLRPIFWEARKQLLEDPESYLNYLRMGKR